METCQPIATRNPRSDANARSDRSEHIFDRVGRETILLEQLTNIAVEHGVSVCNFFFEVGISRIAAALKEGSLGLVVYSMRPLGGELFAASGDEFQETDCEVDDEKHKQNEDSDLGG